MLSFGHGTLGIFILANRKTTSPILSLPVTMAAWLEVRQIWKPTRWSKHVHISLLYVFDVALYIYNYSMLYTFSLGHAMKFSRPGLNLEAACGRAPIHIHKHVQKGLAIWLFQAFYFQNRVHDTNLSPIDDDDDDDDDFVNLYFKLPNLSRTQMLCRSVYIYTTGPVKPQPCTHACIIPCKISEPG